MTTKTNAGDAPADRTLVITRIFNAPRQLVWEAWTKKEHLEQWSCPRGMTMPESHGDLRVGGAWGFVMIAADGEKFPCSGVYREIVPNERLVMTHGWLEDDGTRPHETVVTVSFEDAGAGKTKMTFEQSIFKSVKSRDDHNGGWSQCFDKLSELLAELETKEKS